MTSSAERVEDQLRGWKLMRNAYKQCEVGKRYLLPIPNPNAYGNVFRRCKCIQKTRHLGVFMTPKGYNITFKWFELGKIFERR